jgi:hypothetical protein
MEKGESSIGNLYTNGQTKKMKADNKISDIQLNQILFLKKLKLTAFQVSRILNLNEGTVKRIMNASMLDKGKSKNYVFDWDNYKKRII